MNVPKYAITIASALLFVALFFEKSLGLNVPLYGISTVALLLAFKREFFASHFAKIVAAGFLLTSILYYLYASPFTFFVLVLSFILLIGLHTATPIRNLLFAMGSALPNYFTAIGQFFQSAQTRKQRKRSVGLSKVFRIIFLPLFIIFLFIALYSMGSSYFSDAVGRVFEVLKSIFRKIATYINIIAVFIAILGLFIGVIHSLGLRENSFSEQDAAFTDWLTRVRSKSRQRFRNLDLSMEYKSGVFLLAALSVLLSLLLVLEIKNIWINFTWNGELLKEMVHEGTYILILAILISMAITTYYFRKNLNFYQNNTALKVLAYLWIALNALLVISVCVRNAHYIHYFGLANKRIGVLFFLALCIVGLITLVIKINKVKTTFYVLRINALAAYIALVAVCVVNWDGLIAQYNFGHYKTAYIYLPFMSNLSDKTLPYLHLTDAQISEIENKQVENIPLARRGNFTDLNYKNKIDGRVKSFVKNYPKKHWLERVWAEDRAYEKLK
jgi:hypothetical protein